MHLAATPVPVEAIAAWRDLYRHELNCQVVHDSIDDRPGWTQPHLLTADGAPVGYGSIALAGPWLGKPTVFAFYVLPRLRTRVFDLFETLLAASGAVAIEVQSNEPLLSVLIHACARDVVSESILFHDRFTTDHRPPGARFRRPDGAPPPAPGQRACSGPWIVEMDGAVAATGGILFHYNRPYGDIHMEVTEPFRRRGLGSYLVQELKRVCHADGNLPAARCNPGNLASRRTLQKAGFVPCGHILTGLIPR